MQNDQINSKGVGQISFSEMSVQDIASTFDVGGCRVPYHIVSPVVGDLFLVSPPVSYSLPLAATR
jgi:hypothetical protein